MSTPERLDAVEDAILRADPPVVTAPEIAEIVLEETDVYDDVGDPRREAYDDLSLLERSGDVASKETGAHSRAWWHTDRVLDPPPRDDLDLDADPDDDIPPSYSPGERLADDLDRDRELEYTSDVDDVDETDPVLEDALDDWRPGRSREERVERVDSGLAVLEWLRDRGGAVRRADVLAETYDELAPASQSKDSYWRKTARPALQHAEDADLVRIESKEYEWLG